MLLSPPPAHVKVTLSVIEIYNERIKDLLDPSKDNLQAGGTGWRAVQERQECCLL